MGYGSSRIRNNQLSQFVTADNVKQIIHEIQNPIKMDKLIEADGGAYRSYFFNISKK